MTTNNETGVNNNIIKIGQIAAHHKHRLPLDAGAVLRPVAHASWSGVNDAVSVSFHKLYGPPGIGADRAQESCRRVRSAADRVWDAKNYGLRGGTINTPAIAGPTPASSTRWRCATLRMCSCATSTAVHGADRQSA